jgi:hypothetical protein
MDSRKMKWFYRLSLAEGILCLGFYLFSPGGSGEGQLFSFSKIRIFLILLTMAGIIKYLFPLINKHFFGWVQSKLRIASIRFFLLIWSQLLILGVVSGLRTLWLLYHSTGIYTWQAAYLRLFPLLIWVVLICLQILLFLLLDSAPQFKFAYRSESGLWRRFFVFILIGLAAGIYVYRTRIGLVKDNNFFGKPTVPLLEWHLLAGFLFSLIWIILDQWRAKKIPHSIIRLLPLLIWLLAVGIWLSIPNQEGFFSPPGRAPNYEVYPFSDGSFYGHYARSLAEGMGFKGDDIPPRPLYILILAIFHLIAGNQYQSVILLQTLLLALLPVLVYLIGKDLHSVSAGIGAAWLVILRETNAILSAPFGHNVSTTKYFFSDLPTALACAFFVWMLIRWLNKRKQNSAESLFYALLSGGSLGIMTLIRTQSLSLLIVAIPVMLAGIRKDRKYGFLEGGFFTIAILCCLTPWLIRNQRITGSFIFDHPMTQTGEMAASYNLGGLDMTRSDGMNDAEYSDMLTDVIRKSIQTYPREILAFIGAHFANNEISNLRLFPLRDELAAPEDIIKPRTAFWETLDSANLSSYHLIFLGLSYAVIGLGIAAGMKKNSGSGLIPILICLLYNLSTAVGRYSAGRYLIPVDWILFLYFSIGLAEWMMMMVRLSGHEQILEIRKDADEAVKEKSVNLTRKSAVWLLIFLIIGLSLPLSEKWIPMRFIPATKEEVFAKLHVAASDFDKEGLIVNKAIAIYPRYYAAGEGEPESAKQGYGVAAYGRLVFLTLAPNGFGTIELKTDSVPEYFPDGATIWMIGHENGATSVAERVLVERNNSDVVYYGKK